MFEVPHSHHVPDFKRFFSPGRSSMSAIEDKRAEEFRRHVWAVTMTDEEPLSEKQNRHSTDFARPGANKLRSKRASAYAGLPPQEEEPKPEPTMEEPTIAVQPVQSPTFGSSKDLYPVKEDKIGNFLTSTETSKNEHVSHRASYPIYPSYAVLETSAADPTKSNDPSSKLNRPRKLSDNSIATMSTLQSRESMSAALARRNQSWGSRPSIQTSNSMPQWRPEYMYQRPMPLKKQTPVRAPLNPNELFDTMPTEVLSLIVEKLRDLHVGPKSLSCATCWMRDVCNMCVASHKWYGPAQAALYQDIQLVGPDSAAHKKKFKMSQGARVMMLRRVLRANPRLAATVKTLKVPAPEALAKGTNVADYDNLVASLVMACPNLECLSGLSTPYDHSFTKIFYALSSRPNLKEMNWLVQASPHQKQQRIQSSTQQLGLVMPSELKPFQEMTFLRHHDNWSRLETLTIHCLPGATLTPESLISSTLSYLPNIKHLHLCNLPPNSFDDSNLLALPPLQTLTLSHISGITSNGLSTFATHSSGQPLRKLTLRHTPLTSLAALARILSNLRSLVNFSLIQAFPPIMPEDDAFALWMMPYLASNSIQKLHWDITSHTSCVNAADDILARSIAAGGFPALTTLRALNDPDGIFQALCYPVERIDRPSDRFPHAEQHGDSSSLNFAPSSAASPMSPTRLFKSSSNITLASPRTLISPFGDYRNAPYTSLHTARLAAQSRLEAARSRPRFTVNVIDEGGTTTDTFAMAGFVGTPGSAIKYHLVSDAGTTDDKGGLIDVRDLDGDGGESLAGGREGCTGRWNMRDGVVADRKEKERWWHTERGHWTKLAL
ncbi:hypothetical protein FZEAL_50 [Fusarium zealandicum]|uniref:F-box domain-containing protein n=1 Tax=Fusarium zealandicum TaxID=1053134 RepID=A0A8H4XR90_9HYPO|nr:hypothetical protein FZEAL_50 [Fusarium zealandicum]